MPDWLKNIPDNYTAQLAIMGWFLTLTSKMTGYTIPGVGVAPGGTIEQSRDAIAHYLMDMETLADAMAVKKSWDRPQYAILKEMYLDLKRMQAFKEVSYQLDTLLEASPLTTNILDIIATSSSMTFPKIVGYGVTVHAKCGQPGCHLTHWRFGPCSADVFNLATRAWGSSAEDQGSLLAEDATSSNRQT